MNSTPNSERFYIAIFGKCNVGKSTLLNAITNQNIAIVSNKKGTTTDPVFKAMEIPKIGPCVLIDTPGFDDSEQELGKTRTKKSIEILNYVDAAIFVVENKLNLSKIEIDFLTKIKNKNIPLIFAINEIEENYKKTENINLEEKIIKIKINAKEKKNIDILINLMSKYFTLKDKKKSMISNLIKPFDVVVLIVVMDSAYPKERLILPQQQLIYSVLKKGGIAYILKEDEYEKFLETLNFKPKLVVVDSQIFSKIFKITKKDIPITSFSILLARKRGILEESINGVKSLSKIKDNDKILILESCTHKKQSCDIGSKKIPNWILEYTKKKVTFHFKTGDDFPNNIEQYSLVIHCGGCMTTERKIRYKFNICKEKNIAITNYGILIAFINGVLEKSTSFLNRQQED